MHHVVGLRSRLRRRFEPAGWFGRKTLEVHETAYIWTIDGIDLTDWIRQQVHHLDPTAPVEETIWLAGNTEDALDRLDKLQGRLPPDFDGQRVALLTCPECGDLWCGAFTAELRLTQDTVTWHELGWDSETAEGSPFLFDPPLSLTFTREQYTHALETTRSSLSGE